MSTDALNALTITEDYSAAPADPIKAAIARLSLDAGAVFETEVLAALAALDMVDYARYRQEIKRSKCVVMRDFDEAVKAQRPQGSGGYDDQSIAVQIVEFVQSRSTLFMDADKEAYARIRVGEHWETWVLESSGFKEWVAAELYREAHILPKSEPIKDAILALSGIAKYGTAQQEIEQKPVYLRAGLTPQGAYALDLCNDAWQAVIIEAGSWHIDNQQCVAFKRTKTMQSLPVPLAAGTGCVDELFKLINCPTESQNMLLAWMLECWRTDTAYPIAEIGNTEQGSGKSRAQSTLKRFIDPNTVNLRAKPKAVEDIYVAACNSLLISYENLSHLTEEMQDAFCVLATGGGFAKRQLFKDSEESTLSAKKPVIMNGIGTLATRQDLVDRLINLELDPLKPEDRKTDSELDTLLADKEASIFTGLLDLFAQSLALLPSIQIEQKARMADFCLLGAAVYAARGVENPTDAFMQDYNAMRKEAIYRTLDSSPVASAVIAYLDKHPLGAEFTTAKNAYDVLVQHYTDGESWPRSAKGLTEVIKRISPAFRQIGIKAEVGKQRNSKGYPLVIKYIEPFKAIKSDSASKVIHPHVFNSGTHKLSVIA